MNLSTFTYLLNKPDAVNNEQIIALDKILENFPYFQSARSIHLKGLYKQDSFKYNQSLKTTAAYTTDRAILFDLITSDHFGGIQKDLFQKNENQLLDIEVVDSKNISEEKIKKSIENSISNAEEILSHENTSLDINPLEKSILSSITVSNSVSEITNENQKPIESVTKALDLGKPIPFDKNETHSFQEWLQLAKAKPINRENDNPEETNLKKFSIDQQLEIIDKFIETNPKIQPVKYGVSAQISPIKEEDKSYLMTETLAKVYLEQKKYSKAIQAYEILILKYPEKSSFFANRISDIQLLQQNNNS
jgi:tetratricopeptide (TPR) repeat protein